MKNKDKPILADPYLNKCHGKTRLPGDAVFACAYDLNMGVDTFLEAAFFRRTAETDELWILEDDDIESVREVASKTGPLPCHCEEPASGGRRSNPRHSLSAMNYELSAARLYAGCAYIVPRSGTTAALSCEALLARLFFSRVGCYWPEGFLLPGIIDESTYYRVKGEVDREVDENTRRAQEAKTKIIQVARQLGLSPRPTGLDPRFWYANCPGKGHPLEIKAEDNLFYCGYCRRKGSVEELRMLVAERKKL